MLWYVKDALREVKVALDLNASDPGLHVEGDEDTLTIDQLILSKLEDGVKAAHMGAPAWALDLGVGEDRDPQSDWVMSESVHWESQKTAEGGRHWGWVLLPEDFMRLVVFKMSDWDRAVYGAMTTEDPRYRLQRGRIAGLRGSPERPVCVLGIRPEGRVLEFYSCRSREAEVTRAVYIPYPKIEEGHIWVSERCRRAAVYATASLALLTLGETERATALQGLVSF